jgi:hypothetical protein
MSFFGLGYNVVRKKKLSESKRNFLDAVTEYRQHHPRLSEREAEEWVIRLQTIDPNQFERLVRNARERY